VLGIGAVMMSTHDGRQIAQGIAKKIEELCESKSCPPCTPYPVGTIGYQGPEVGTKGRDAGVPHYWLYEVQQKPSNCECFWRERTKAIAGGHHYYDQPNPAMSINLNGAGRPPRYPR
jgi:type VI secretion system secreted protein VgrG